MDRLIFLILWSFVLYLLAAAIMSFIEMDLSYFSVIHWEDKGRAIFCFAWILIPIVLIGIAIGENE